MSSITTPWGPIGYPTFKRTYARRLSDAPNAPTEEFPETIDRVIEACRTQLNVGFTPAEEDDLRRLLLELKGSVAGRFLWQLGTETVSRLGMFSLQNCAFVVVDAPIRPFTWTMDALMLGSGVGFNIQRKHVRKLPRPKRVTITRQDDEHADYIVEDSREGWVELLRRTLVAHFITGNSFTYSTIRIRPKGAVIRGFGGLASGPEPLCQGIAWISDVLNARAGKTFRPIDALDVMNIIGYIVVSGNVRRSAEIAIGDCDDTEYLNAKQWLIQKTRSPFYTLLNGASRTFDRIGWTTGADFFRRHAESRDGGWTANPDIPNWRGMSNNSVVCNDIAELPEEFWKGYTTKGREPYGLINLKLARAVGRLGDHTYTDPDVEGFNPCAEQSLANHETCCLAETFLPNITSFAELLRILTYLYRINKHSLALPSHSPETEAIVHKNMRMGIGVTGYLQATDEQRSWLTRAYEHLRKYDERYSAAHGWPISIKLTTCKPSGTLSLLPGVTPGVHPGTSMFFLRRVRMAANIPLVEVCREHGYHIEYQRNFDGTDDLNTVVVSFPCRYPEGTVVAADLTAIKQLEWVKRLQTEWSDNSVSCTVYFRDEELPEIRQWLAANYNDSCKTVSFLRHQDHGFDQAPYEEISEEQYHALATKVIPITGVDVSDSDTEWGSDCAGGACPIK